MKHRHGFTLVEVMVALLIIGLALPALLSQLMSQVDATAHLRDKTLAGWIARDQLERLRLQQRFTGQEPNLAQSGRRQLAGREWEWSMETEATAMPGIMKQTVHAGLAGAEPLLSLSAYQVPRSPVQEPQQ